MYNQIIALKGREDDTRPSAKGIDKAKPPSVETINSIKVTITPLHCCPSVQRKLCQ
ncbi:hypothetical protein D3C85_1559960 [compost metagenome]